MATPQSDYPRLESLIQYLFRVNNLANSGLMLRPSNWWDWPQNAKRLEGKLEALLEEDHEALRGCHYDQLPSDCEDLIQFCEGFLEGDHQRFTRKA